jgi:hypothetical protein
MAERLSQGRIESHRDSKGILRAVLGPQDDKSCFVILSVAKDP